MTTPTNLATRASILAAHAKAKGITQLEISKAINASQGQVSRILNGHIQKESKLFTHISEYVYMRSKQVTIESVRENRELMEALASCWDGTPQHAHALSMVIRALGQVFPRSDGLSK